MAKLKPKVWEPKYPDAARPANPGTPREGELLPAPDDSGDLPWTDAPPTSHLQKFRFYDARNPRFRRFLKLFGNNESMIQVRFRPSGSRGFTEYLYFFKDHAEAGRVWDALVAAAHPGEVVHAKLELAGVPYRRTA